MAEFYLREVTVTCNGDAALIKDFSTALKAGENQSVKAALSYFDGCAEYLEDRVIFSYSESYNDDLDFPYCFKPLTLDFPDIVFTFDFYYEGTAAGCWGNGRYYCIYEKGKKVYDANGWIEHLGFFNLWLSQYGVSGDFYEMNTDEMVETIARVMLKDAGKKINDKAIIEYIGNNLANFEGSVYDDCNIKFLYYGKDYFYWSKNLNDNDDLYEDEVYGYHHYLELKEKGELPGFFAVSRWKNLFNLDNYKEEDEKSSVRKEAKFEKVTTTETALAAVQRNGFSLASMPDEFKTAEVCLAAVQQNGLALNYVPEALKTMGLCLAAVQQNGYALKDVPDTLKSQGQQALDLCLAAVRQNKWALQYVPEELKEKVR